MHKDQATKDWFYPDFARHANSPAPTPEEFVTFLDTPLCVIIEVVSEKTIKFDSAIMRDMTSAALEGKQN
jgi:Uma2 family endonuclease